MSVLWLDLMLWYEVVEMSFGDKEVWDYYIFNVSFVDRGIVYGC